MVTEFYNQEKDYEAYLATGPAFICNGLGMGAIYHRLHRSDCNSLHQAGPAKYGLHTSVRKACSRDLDELVLWLTREFGPEGKGYAFCQFCFKDGLDSQDSRRLAKGSP